ncbi:related to asparaginase 2 [Serendipita indica DSM 11827]|uniref:Related to asparaginase 2 n=1 Tax=Serendipita indica (strain DSM 11827) TaxID=1109443 RepID=G4TK20_SERID|nr:related to asparaginase 2 [Serendipita indica DSM 11827]
MKEPMWTIELLEPDLDMSEKVPLLSKPSKVKHKRCLVIHGGAGIFDKSRSTPEQREIYKSALRVALIAGHSVLVAGGSSVDAAVAAVASMEDCPLFNCAKGAVFNVAGKNELEASIMVSRPPSSLSHIPQARRGFSATLLRQAKNPSRLVQGLYERPDLVPHAFLSDATAEVELGKAKLGLELVDPSYFYTEQRWREHRRGLGLPEEPLPFPPDLSSPEVPREPIDLMPTGTVGAVALDDEGCIAVVTSTGGRTNKLVGRIGDTPSMGSGFWAEEWDKPRKGLSRFFSCLLGYSRNKRHAVGVSGTGDGDYFIRQATCATLGSRVKLLGESLQKASDNVVQHLEEDGGVGGVIALDSKGTIVFALNCSGMFRGLIRDDGRPLTAIFKEDVLS